MQPTAQGLGRATCNVLLGRNQDGNGGSAAFDSDAATVGAIRQEALVHEGTGYTLVEQGGLPSCYGRLHQAAGAHTCVPENVPATGRLRAHQTAKHHPMGCSEGTVGELRRKRHAAVRTIGVGDEEVERCNDMDPLVVIEYLSAQAGLV